MARGQESLPLQGVLGNSLLRVALLPGKEPLLVRFPGTEWKSFVLPGDRRTEFRDVPYVVLHFSPSKSQKWKEME